MDQLNKLQADFDEIQRKVSEITGQVAGLQPPSLGSADTSFHPIPTVTPPSAANQIRNGELGHSNDTWFFPPPGNSAIDQAKECAWWFSNNAPVAGQILDFTISPASSVNKTLKAYGDFGGVHSTYDAAYCDWDRTTGEARFQGDKSLDAPFPNNRLVTPNRAVEFVGFLIARRNSTIVCPDDCHLYGGAWDNTTGDWISAANAFAVTAAVRGTPAGTTERRYRVYAHTDRGYTFLSAEVALVGAPDDASFGPTVDVYLTWTRITGILEYWIYRYDVTANKYRLLTKIGSGANTYGDNNSILLADEGGYPVGARDRGFAYVATATGDLAGLPVDGEAPWQAGFLNIPVPSDYDVNTTTAEQVLRLGLSKALDRQMVDASVFDGSDTNLVSNSAEFTALDLARSITVTDGDGNQLVTTIALINSPTSIEMADIWPFDVAVNATLYIVGGGDHGLLIDAIHVSYVNGSAFAAYPDDLNRLDNGGQNPIAAPNHSSQGGAGGGGTGGGGDGGITCVEESEPVAIMEGDQVRSVPFTAVHRGDLLFNCSIQGNVVQDIQSAVAEDLHILRTENGIEIRCSPSHRIWTSTRDVNGTAVSRLRAGDFVLTCVFGRIERSRIVEIIATGQRAKVRSVTLAPGHAFIAGRLRQSRWSRMLSWVRRERGACGVVSHNAKQPMFPGQDFPL